MKKEENEGENEIRDEKNQIHVLCWVCDPFHHIFLAWNDFLDVSDEILFVDLLWLECLDKIHVGPVEIPDNAEEDVEDQEKRLEETTGIDYRIDHHAANKLVWVIFVEDNQDVFQCVWMLSSDCDCQDGFQGLLEGWDDWIGWNHPQDWTLIVLFYSVSEEGERKD